MYYTAAVCFYKEHFQYILFDYIWGFIVENSTKIIN